MDISTIIRVLKGKGIVPRLEGDQLKLVGITTDFPEELLAQVKAKRGELIAFLKIASQQLDYIPVESVASQESYAVSGAQKRLWILCQFDEAATAYNIAAGFYIRGKIIYEYFNEACRLVVQRHESLRTVFKEINGDVRQVILEEPDFAVDYEDLSLSADKREQVKIRMQEYTDLRLNLRDGSLLRIKLCRVTEETFALLVVVHHIVSDGWSVRILVKDIMDVYGLLCKGNAPALSPLPVQYKDYVNWLGYREKADDAAASFWRTIFGKDPEPLYLPTDFPRPARQSYEGAVSRFYISDDQYNAIQAFCKDRKATMFNFFHAALSILLAKLSGQITIRVGTPVAGRNHRDLEGQVGLFVNTLPLQLVVNDEDLFDGLLYQSVEHAAQVFARQDYPLDKIIDELEVKRDTGRHPLFDVVLVVQHHAAIKADGVNIGLLDHWLYPASGESIKRPSKFDLLFSFAHEPEKGMCLEIEYAVRLFKKERINRFYTAFQCIVEQALLNASVAVKAIANISGTEKQKILQGFNKAIGSITEFSIMGLLESSFKQHALLPAVFSGDRVLTYHELDLRSDKLARSLLTFTEGPGKHFIGLLTGRTEIMIIGILGILKAGAAYVPMDTAYPAERINYIITDAALGCILVDDTGRERLPAGYGGKVVCIDRCESEEGSASLSVIPVHDLREQPAYLIYTSGSTGMPKGVEICHRNTIAFLKWAMTEFSHTPFEVLYATTSYCFDLSVFEFLFPLLAGKRIRLLASALEIPAYASKDSGVMLNTVPSVVRNLLDTGMDWQPVSALNMAGEVIPVKTANELGGLDMEIRNLYGPSEDTTYSTVFRFGEYAITDSVPIGKPVGFTQLYIMDRHQHLLPPGFDGEIYLSGQSVANGYYNRPALTAEKFLPNPFVPGCKMYRTGDTGRWLENGMVEYTGRIDDQVKIRGYRIELGEIQHCLELHPQVAQAIAVGRTIENEQQIVVYWTGNEALTDEELSAYLMGQVPEYMLPGFWIRLDTFPLNSNGKIDKKKLPDPVADSIGKKVIREADNELEAALLALWKKLFGGGEIGVTHNFFDIGGHSLKAMKLRYLVSEELGRELSMYDIFNHPTVAGQAAIIAAQATRTVDILPATVKDVYKLSSSQRSLWILSQFETSAIAYHMPGIYLLEGELNADVFANALYVLIARHEILRTVFKEDRNGEAGQVVLPMDNSFFSIEQLDLRSKKTSDTRLNLLLTAAALKPFDLVNGPLVRAGLYRTEDQKWFFACTFHHIIADGWSLGLLLRELQEVYQALLKGMPNPLAPLPIHYKDYAAWQQEELASGKMETHKAYWLTQFEGDLPRLNLTGDQRAYLVRTNKAGTVCTTFDAGLSATLKRLSQNAGGTLFTGLLALVNVFLYRYTGQEDIIVGSVVANRPYASLENQVGFYANTIALRTRLTGTDSYETLLNKVKATTFDAYKHQSYPFTDLVDLLDLPYHPGRNPLFDIMVVLQHTDSGYTPDVSFAGLSMKAHHDTIINPVKVNLSFDFREKENTIQFSLEYNTDIYTGEMALQMAAHLEQLLRSVTEHPTVPLRQLVYLKRDEIHELLVTRNSTRVIYPAHKTVVDLFEEQARSRPDHVAVIFEDTTLDYAELDAKANALAWHLKKNCHAGSNSLIGLLLERNENLIVALLGVLKSGAAYLPLDPEYPSERIAYMVSNSGCSHILNDDELQAVVTDKGIAVSRPEVQIHPDSLAYVMYTSGSTGKPKGVRIPHRALYDYVQTVINYFLLTSADRVIQQSSVSFDVAVEEIFPALSVGAGVLLLKEGGRNTENLLSAIEDNGATVLSTTPLVIQELNAYPETMKKLRFLISGGDELKPAYVSNLLQVLPVYNTYGPTESTVCATYKRMELLSDVNVIGKPIANRQIYIVDEVMQPVPAGVAGEICIAGAGLAEGYSGSDAGEKDRFADSPFDKGTRIYKTGDLGRWLFNGDIEFLGRKDEQLKIRGYRIEPAEIEKAMLSYPSVTGAVVLALAGEEKLLTAYFTASATVALPELRHYLGTLLPTYMLPSHFICMPVFPVTMNGKVDKKNFPRPVVDNTAEDTRPCKGIEKQLIAVWQEVLGKPRIRTTDSFFELGGQSIKATRLVGMIYRLFNVKLSLKEIFEHYILEDQANLIDRSRKETFRPILPAAVQPDYPLSSPQRRLWILAQFEQSRIAYNMSEAFLFEGKLDTSALGRALQIVTGRHESLRTVFRENDNGELRQVILPVDVFPDVLTIADISNERNAIEYAKELASAAMAEPFVLTDGPLLKAKLFCIADGQWIFAFVIHHIISDGWSMDIFIKEVLHFYGKDQRKETTESEPLRIQYKDYAVWQQEEPGGDSFQRSRAYWLEQFSGVLPVLELPTDHPRSLVRTYNGGSVYSVIEPDIKKGIDKICIAHNATLHMALLAGVNVLLYRYTYQEDIITGTPVSGREQHPDLTDQIGFYVNMLPLRTKLNGKESFSVLLEHVKDVTTIAYQHQSYPFDTLVDELQLHRDMSRNPLFDVCVVLEQGEESGGYQNSLEGISIKPFETATPVSNKFDLTFTFEERDQSLGLTINYSKDIFTEATAEQLAKHLFQLLGSIVKTPGVPIEGLEILSCKEKQALLEMGSAATMAYPSSKRVITLFEEQVLRAPDNTALVDDNDMFTYAGLNIEANRFGEYLQHKYDIGVGDIVGIKPERSCWMVVCILGVLKSGAAYMPIDPVYPAERVDYMLSDCGCKLLVDENEWRVFNNERNNYSPHNLTAEGCVSDLVYVIYTSGSTGSPKGVMVENQSLNNLCHWHISNFSVTQTDRATLYAGVAFDASVWELFPYLLAGASVYIIPDEIRLHPEGIADYYEQNGITISFLPTQAGELFLKTRCSSLRYLLLGGDKLASFTPQSYHVVNNYGPTECTVVATSYPVNSFTLNIPIGKPVSNTSIYVLDRVQGLCPPGVNGEIYISGDSLARGYHNMPQLTTEKFVDDPYKPGKRMYRTGDFGRWLPDGNLLFTGRVDEQIKIRGYRIEPGEVEYVLNGFSGISSAVVLAEKDQQGDGVLSAYILADNPVLLTDIRSYLSGLLPPYMIPGRFVMVESMPLTANGKIDHRALSYTSGVVMSSIPAYAPPRDAIEEQLAVIWQEVLGISRVGIYDHFFESGGHSLSITRLSAHITRVFGIKPGMQDLFARAIFEEQAVLIRNTHRTVIDEIPNAPEADHYPLASSQQRIWILSQFEEASIAYHIPGAFIFEGELNLAALDFAFDKLIKRHEVLRTVFRTDQQANVYQQILELKETGFAIRFADLRTVKYPEEEVRTLVDANTVASFDLSSGPLLRAAVYQVAENRWVFSYVMHHIIGDGWSVNILVQELLLLYNDSVNHTSSNLPVLRIQYKDYAVWQRAQAESAAMLLHRQYWLGQFSGELPVLNMQGDKQRPPVKTYKGSVVQFNIDPAATRRLKEAGLQHGATMFMALLAAVNGLLYRYTDQNDIITGSPVAGRADADLAGQLGLYVNTIALRMRFSKESSYAELLRTAKQITLEAYDHQAYPFDRLVEELDLKKDLSRSPLFDVLLVFQDKTDNPNQYLRESGQLSIEPYTGIRETVSKFDLSFIFEESDTGLLLSIEYNTDVFAEVTVKNLLQHFNNLLLWILEKPDQPIVQADFMCEKEKDQLLCNFNPVQVLYTDERSIGELLEAQAAQTPDSIALSFENKKLTYRELNARANSFARYLQKEYNVQPEDIAGIRLKRSELMIIALLGVLKSGSAYVPLDPDYPEERIAYILEDSGAKLIIDNAFMSTYMSVQGAYDSCALKRSCMCSNLAYVIYTSGSTGVPKGVMIEHRSVTAFISWCKDEFGDADFDTVLGVTSICFDLSVFEIIYTLCAGKQLRLLENATVINEYNGAGEKILINTVPSVVGALTGGTMNWKQVTVLNMAGEPVPEKYTSVLDCEKIEVRNLYGPSEDTTYSTVYRLKKDKPVYIGRPISNTIIYILNQYAHLQPVGVAGEICIAGAGLARGYLNRPEQTKERFVADPFRPGGYMYKTGDLAMWKSDGNISYLGRIDMQVKIRGYRIEPGEIEAVLQTHPDIIAVAVEAKRNKANEQQLVAYIVARNEQTDRDLKLFLGKTLPAYMVPAYFIQLPALPMTPNGKIDRKKLPDSLVVQVKQEYVAARNPTEEQLVLLFEEILGRENIGVRDNFFDLGGNSLNAVQLITRVNQLFLVKINIQDIFIEPTIENIGVQINFILNQNRQKKSREELTQIQLDDY